MELTDKQRGLILEMLHNTISALNNDCEQVVSEQSKAIISAVANEYRSIATLISHSDVSIENTILSCLRDRNLIGAIRILRYQTGLPLREAKTAVELIRQQVGFD